MKIIITNIVVLNGGDGAILFGMLKALKHVFGEKSEIVVFASEPVAAAKMYPEVNFRETLGLGATRAPRKRYIGRIIRVGRTSIYATASWFMSKGFEIGARLLLNKETFQSLKIYSEADLVISSGGTYLTEEWGTTSQTCDYRLTLLLRRPLAFFTQSLGPFKYPETQRDLRPIFDSACCILLRDERSSKNLQDLKVKNENIYVCADAAFALADPEVLERAKRRCFPKERSLRVAISVRFWPHFKTCDTSVGMDRYIQAMASITDWLVQTVKAQVTFLSTCQGIPEYDNDSEIAAQIVKRMPSNTAKEVVVETHFQRFDTLLNRLPEYDLVLATRMHMAILSLMAGTPVVPFAFEFKTKELFKKLEMEKWVLEAENCDAKAAFNHIQSFIAAMPNLRIQLFERVKQECISAREAAMHIKMSLSKIKSK